MIDMNIGSSNFYPIENIRVKSSTEIRENKFLCAKYEIYNIEIFKFLCEKITNLSARKKVTKVTKVAKVCQSHATNSATKKK